METSEAITLIEEAKKQTPAGCRLEGPLEFEVMREANGVKYTAKGICYILFRGDKVIFRWELPTLDSALIMIRLTDGQGGCQ